MYNLIALATVPYYHDKNYFDTIITPHFHYDTKHAYSAWHTSHMTLTYHVPLNTIDDLFQWHMHFNDTTMPMCVTTLEWPLQESCVQCDTLSMCQRNSPRTLSTMKNYHFHLSLYKGITLHIERYYSSFTHNHIIHMLMKNNMSNY